MLGFCVFIRVDFVWLLMSNSELLRIKNRLKTPYKKTKDCKQLFELYIKRPNDALSLQKIATKSHKLQNNQGKTMIAKDSFVPLL